VTIGLFSPMGTGNLGDATTQDALIYNLRKRIPNIEIHGFSLNAEDTTRRHGIPAFPVSRIHWGQASTESENVSQFQAVLQKNKFVSFLRRLVLRIPQELLFNIQAFRHVRTLDLVIFSGSGQLSDVWGDADRHSYSILRWTILAKIAGIPVLFISVGAGPLASAINRIFIKWALSMAQYRSFRDVESLHYMADIGFDRSDPVFPDLAHSIPAISNHRQRPSASERFVVGISPMAYAAPGLWYSQHSDIYQTYLNKLAEFTKWLIENRFEIVFFPSAVPPDNLVIKEVTDIVKEKYGIALNGDHPPVQTVTDLFSKIESVDLVVASRFHAILLSFVLDKPVIALSYHPKDTSLMHDMGQKAYCLQIEDFEVQSLKDCFQSIQSELATVREQIIEKENEYRSLLEKQYTIVLEYLKK
jgi:polysaccharide pyruvyl transferase WcaK-like protein